MVSDTVLIEKPYHVESCKAAPGGSKESVERIKKVLRMEKDKLELKAAKFDVANVRGQGAGQKDGVLRKGG